MPADVSGFRASGSFSGFFSVLICGNEQDDESRRETAIKTPSFSQSSREQEGADHWGFRARKTAGGLLKAAYGQAGLERPIGEPTKRFIVESGNFQAVRGPEVISIAHCHVASGGNTETWMEKEADLSRIGPVNL